MWLVLALYFSQFIKVFGDDADLNKCMEISTFGYGYDALYRFPTKGEGKPNRITLYIKAQSDAHIVLTSNTAILDHVANHMSPLFRGPKILELVLGGGKNTFSEIRVGTWGGKKLSRSYEKTPDILSPNEYRGFWIEVPEEGKLRVGQADNDTAFLEAETMANSEMVAFRASYFGISTWNNVKGHWRINCPQQQHTEIDDIEETTLSPMQKLKRDMTMFYDVQSIPLHPNSTKIQIEVLDVHVTHFTMSEKSGQITVEGKIFLKWNDWKLKWDVTDYNNISWFMSPDTDIWTPSLHYFTNSGMMGAVMVDSEIAAKVKVYNNGYVQYSPSFYISVVCDLHIPDWPKDHHICQVDIGVLLDLLQLNGDNKRIDLLVDPDQPWKIDGMSSQWILSEIHLLESVEDQPFITVLFTFTRIQTIFITVFGAPFFAIAAMGMSSFCLKHDNAGRFYLSCISSLLLTAFLVTIASEIPAASRKVPTIVSLYMWGLLLSCGSILHYICVKNVRNWTWTLPYWCRLVLTNPLLETCFCLELDTNDGSGKNMESIASGESRDWIRVTLFFERIGFLAYLGAYLALWINFLI